jgi:hypothetical protein
MFLPEARVVARGMDLLIAALWVGNLAWVTWQLAGALPGTMVVALPWAFGLAGMVALRWWVIHATGAPRGWWYPLPLMAWVSVHMGGLAELPSRGQLHGWHVWSGVTAFWVGLHLARDARIWRGVLAGVGVIALGVVGAAIYQRIGDPAWLPLGRDQARQYLSRSAGTLGNPNTMAAWLALVLPLAIAVMWSHGGGGSRVTPRLAGVFAVAVLGGIGLSYSRGVILALILCGGIAVLFCRRWSWWLRIGSLLSAGIIFFGLLWWGYQSSQTLQQRVDTLVEFEGERTRPLLWGIAIDLWQQRPIVGYGGGSFRHLMEQHRPEGLWESAEFAHNDYLSGLNAYGLVGAGLAVWGVMALFWRGWTVRHQDAGYGWSLAVLGLAVVVDFHLQAPAVWWLAAALAGAWILERTSRGGGDLAAKRKRPASLGAGGAITLVCWVLPLMWAVPLFQGEELRWRARESLDELSNERESERVRAVARAAEKSLRQAIALDTDNERTWGDLAYAVSLQGLGDQARADELGQRAEEAAREALRGSPLVAEHWVRLGVALDQQGRWAEAGPVFGRAITMAPRQPMIWYYQAFHLSLKPASRELALAALATCLRLDPGHEEAKLLLAQLERTP